MMRPSRCSRAHAAPIAALALLLVPFAPGHSASSGSSSAETGPSGAPEVAGEDRSAPRRPADLATRPLPAGYHGVPTPHTQAATAARRARVAERLPAGLLVLFSGEDADGRFHPDGDFLWLTGVFQANAYLVLEADGSGLVEAWLFLPERDPRRDLWDGQVLYPGPEAVERTGIAQIHGLRRFAEILAERLAARGEEAEDVRLFGDGPRLETFAESREIELNPGLAVRNPRAGGGFRQRFLRDLQAVKDPGEMDAVRAAVDITQAALIEGFLQVRPGNFEFQAEAAIEGGFRHRGASGTGFSSIVGSGPNSCILHYRENQRRFEDGDIVVIDVGARVHGYTADVSRTVPVSGRFTPRQREIYEHVVQASLLAAAELRPGATLRDAHQAAARYFDAHDLGRYFPHSVGHGFGLRVHDTPLATQPLAPDMVVTIEPGLYIAAEALGVRIENCWRITEDGAELLSDAIPFLTDELEAFLARLHEHFPPL